MEPQLSIDPDLVRWSERVDPARPLLVLLHGRGADEADLEGLIPFLPRAPVVASLRAPISEGPGFSWYPMSLSSLGAPADAEVDAAVQAILAWMDALPSVSATGLLGFSQGGAIALQLLRYRPRAFAFAVVLSGFVIEGDQQGDSELAELQPPAFWGRGTLDTVISDLRIKEAARWLPQHTTLEAKTYETGHSITRPELVDVSAFIVSALSGR
jgi:phospholipase/carboxylesterase